MKTADDTSKQVSLSIATEDTCGGNKACLNPVSCHAPTEVSLAFELL